MSVPPNHALDRVLTPTHTLWLGIALFLMGLYPLLTFRIGRPTGWFGEFVFLFCACVSFVASPGLTVALFIDSFAAKRTRPPLPPSGCAGSCRGVQSIRLPAYSSGLTDAG
jgi:hypothetical protein